MRELDTNNHSVFAMYYHLVLVIKYRRKVINEDISVRLQEIFENIQDKYNITLLEWNHDKDHDSYIIQSTSKHRDKQIYKRLQKCE